MSWSPERTADGSWTLRSTRHGESCHSASGAWAEARARYAAPCELARRAGCAGSVRLLDVGTGLGWNLAAALEELAPAGARLEAVTLERDPSVLEAALELDEGDVGRPWIGLARGALARALEASDGAASFASPATGRLVLALGDARRTLPALPGEALFDAVFLDPFSPRREPELWEPAFLAEVARRMAPGSLLSTYTASFGVRAALARAGLSVGRGPAFGAKREGTLASPDRALPPLEPRVLRRLAQVRGREGESFLGGPREERPRSID